MSSLQLSKILKPAACSALGSRRSIGRYSSPEIDGGTVQKGLVWNPRIADWISGVGFLGVPTITRLAKDRLAAVDEHHRIVAGIHEDVPAAEVLGQPAAALQIGDDLADPVVDGGVERPDGLGADDAVHRQALAFLVDLDDGDQRLVVDIGRRDGIAARRGRARPGACAGSRPAGRWRPASTPRRRAAAYRRRSRAWPARSPAPSAARGSRPWAAGSPDRRRSPAPRPPPSGGRRARPCAGGCRCPGRPGWPVPGRSRYRWHRPRTRP